VSLPIQIFHPVFQQFSDRIDDPEFRPDEATIASVSSLMPAIMELFPSERDASYVLFPLLSDLLGRVSSTRFRTSDATVRKRIGNIDFPLVCIKYKLASGEESSDPFALAAHSVREDLVSEEVCGF
jgi:hypothetical protein